MLGLPRIRGGVSSRSHPASCLCSSSPHTRGCFWCAVFSLEMSSVFPAYAGVFPAEWSWAGISCSLPRIRGGVSASQQPEHRLGRSSPHTRGCFCAKVDKNPPETVFPAYAGVFLKRVRFFWHSIRLPRIRGGVSDSIASHLSLLESSPHTRGCFFKISYSVEEVKVFPAYAGVFPGDLSRARGLARLPRIRGGVSDVIFKK